MFPLYVILLFPSFVKRNKLLEVVVPFSLVLLAEVVPVNVVVAPVPTAASKFISPVASLSPSLGIPGASTVQAVLKLYPG
ncbi:hypothetical protein ACQ9BO_18165 [Flavobacterium sp. P21]|uniref:hypothetical protein n=1 Tax=Flavobacterium sp. P21 TaxID=3423948 RepID=UPI003D67A260